MESFIDYFAKNSDRIIFLLIQHVQVVLIAVAAATVVAVAIAIGTERSPRMRSASLSVTGTILTIPSFALFGLMFRSSDSVLPRRSWRSRSMPSSRFCATR